VTLAALTAGCGRERVEPPETVRPAAPARSVPAAFPDAGLFLDAPRNWPFRRGTAPLVASASSGTATIALWRYLRSEPLPRSEEALEAAQTALEDAAEARDGTFTLQSGRRTKVDGAPAIELVGTQTMAGRKRRVRSTHVYAKGAEVVLDEYAAPEDFERVDREVFRPVAASLRIDPPR
jgi:hypothetical protein